MRLKTGSPHCHTQIDIATMEIFSTRSGGLSYRRESRFRDDAPPPAGDEKVMKLATIQTDDGFRTGVVTTDAGSPAYLELLETAADLRSLIRQGKIQDVRRMHPVPLEPARLMPPIPNPGKLLCLAGNYREHIIESGYAAPDADDVITPQVFLKPSTCLIADGATIPIYPHNVAVG